MEPEYKTYVVTVRTEVELEYEMEGINAECARENAESFLPDITEFYRHHITDPYLDKVLSVREVSADKDTESTTY